MHKKVILVALLLLFFSTAQASAKCDLSTKNFKNISQKQLDSIYSYNSFGLKKPKLIVSSKKVNGFYAEELNSVITIYPKSFNDAYCDQYFDGLTPFVAQVIGHEYIHHVDERIGLSKKIGLKSMSEDTAYLGEKVLDKKIWRTGYYTQKSTKSANRKYLALAKIFKPNLR